MTLGVVLTLGAVTGGRGQELSGSVTAANGPSWDGFVLPSVPENWADLPFKLTASQTVSYNSNVNAFSNWLRCAGRGARRFHNDDQFWLRNQGKLYPVNSCI